MGLFGLFGGGNSKPLEEYLEQRDGEFWTFITLFLTLFTYLYIYLIIFNNACV